MGLKAQLCRANAFLDSIGSRISGSSPCPHEKRVTELEEQIRMRDEVLTAQEADIVGLKKSRIKADRKLDAYEAEAKRLRDFVAEWSERFGFMAIKNPRDSFESIDEVACLMNAKRSELQEAVDYMGNSLNWIESDNGYEMKRPGGRSGIVLISETLTPWAYINKVMGLRRTGGEG